MAHGRLPGSASKLHATASPASPCRGRLRFASFLWVHCDFDLMSFLEREVKEKEDGVVVGVGSPLAEQPLPLISTEKVHAVAKSTLSKVQIPRCRKGQSPTTLSEVDVVQNPTLPKKKKSLNLAGIWLDRACESEALDSSGRVPWPGRIETRARHVPGPVTGIWLVSFRTFS